MRFRAKILVSRNDRESMAVMDVLSHHFPGSGFGVCKPRTPSPENTASAWCGLVPPRVFRGKVVKDGGEDFVDGEIGAVDDDRAVRDL